ncbi:MAG: hypothetical protein M1829_006358 [Trizodia sp. TS-e1964]|nr:MAG: hypothetical protein M1829_006358 [Trizodia sp. TS-e1964]
MHLLTLLTLLPLAITALPVPQNLPDFLSSDGKHFLSAGFDGFVDVKGEQGPPYASAVAAMLGNPVSGLIGAGKSIYKETQQQTMEPVQEA